MPWFNLIGVWLVGAFALFSIMSAFADPDLFKRIWFAIASLTRVCIRCLAHTLGFHLIPAKHKRKIHIAILGTIAADLIHSGWKLADMGFLMLSFLMEGEDAEQHAKHAKPIDHHTLRHDSSQFPCCELPILPSVAEVERLKCGLCGEWWPCSGVNRKDINPLANGVHFIDQSVRFPASGPGSDDSLLRTFGELSERKRGIK